MASSPAQRRRATAGFTLLEVLVAIAIVAIAVFPMLQICQEAELAAFDAKFAELACNQVRILLSDIIEKEKPGATGSGDLAGLVADKGHNERFAYESVRYEWEVRAVDLSSDLAAADEEDPEEGLFGDRTFGDDELNDDEIDDRYRARYVKITVYYVLDDEEEDQDLVVETYVPPLPKEELGYRPGDLVAPNQGNN